MERQQDEHQKYLVDIDLSHQKLQKENEKLQQKLTDNDRILNEFATLENNHVKFKLMEGRLETVEKLNVQKDKEIENLLEKVEYLQNLLVRAEKR